MQEKQLIRRKKQQISGNKSFLHPFDWLQKEIDALFKTYYRGLKDFDLPHYKNNGWEISETEDELEIKIEIPGMKKDQIQIILEGNVLTVSGEREKKREKKRRKYHLSEIQYGAFSRSVILPVNVDPEEIKTKFKRGILLLTFKKTKADQKQQNVVEET